MMLKEISKFYLFAVLMTPVLLPEELPNWYLETQGFVSFQEPSGTAKPIFTSMDVDGVTAHAAQVSQVFTDTAFAYLPLGTSIQKSKDSKGREIWDYPIGTEVAHKIVFNDSAHQLFEIRMLRKVADAQWDFATYLPDTSASGPVLKRAHYTGAAKLSLRLELASGAKPQIDLTRINLASCRNCHFASSVASYQYHGFSDAGPCGFTPNNAAGIQPYIDAYQKKYGYLPFKE